MPIDVCDWPTLQPLAFILNRSQPRGREIPWVIGAVEGNRTSDLLITKNLVYAF